MKQPVRIISEWDIGKENFVYASKEITIKNLAYNENINEILKSEAQTLEELIKSGLVVFEPVTIINE